MKIVSSFQKTLEEAKKKIKIIENENYNKET